MDSKTPNSPPIPPCHGQVCWDATTQSSEEFFFIATFIVLDSFSIPVLPEGVAVAASPSSLIGAISWKQGQSPPEQLPSRGNPDPRP